MDHEKKILKEIADTLALPASDIDTDFLLQEDLGLNPVEIADLLNSLSDKFNIFFEPEETENIKSVENIIEIIEDKMLE